MPRNQETPEPKRLAYFGREASYYLTTLIGGKKVRLEYDVGHLTGTVAHLRTSILRMAPL